MRMLKRLTLLAFVACAPRPQLDDAKLDVNTVGKKLPAGFLWGTATAAHQSEGGNTNDWSAYEMGSFPDGKPHILNNAQSGLAVDSWNRFDEDLALMKSLGVTSYRFSIEWSRLVPTPRSWNSAAMERYKTWVTKLRQNGIEPMVTLHHFSQPQWFAEKGGFEKEVNIVDFVDFVERSAKELGDQVDFWCPFNELNIFAAQGYLTGVFPPAKKGDTKTQALVMANILKAHAQAAAALRKYDTVDANGDGKATLITTAHHVRVFQPASNSALDTAIAALTDDFANESVPRALKTGRIILSIPGAVDIDEFVPGLKDSIDVLGINYYTRDMVRADLGSASLSQLYYRVGRPTSSLGWDIYPDGLYTFLTRFQAYGWPMYITENGTDDRSDSIRSDFLLRHIAAIERAVADGADVRGYYHWSLTDNFEWAEGFAPRFGLFKIDYDNNVARSASKGAEVFKKIGENIPR
jgi:beta-glucosidase